MCVLWACSLLIIPPPPPERPAIKGGFPADLTEINLSDWASLVQDVAAGLQALPLGLSNCLHPEAVTLLQCLESVTQVRFCHHCYQPETKCRCTGASPLVSLPSWSQIMEQTPGYGTPVSSSVMTTLSTSLGGVPGLVTPPPGLSIWDPSPWETLISQHPVTTSSCRSTWGEVRS